MSRRFLPEVQMLRAVAVALVVVYHLQPGLLPGGFVGVDVFFVISGYLITGHLLREHERTGRIRLSAFWTARARRILPAGLLCIAVTLTTAYVVYPPTQWDDLGLAGVAAALSMLNWLLATQSVDYQSSLNAATPLQHFWSLGVEEQFYLLWPLIVLVACALASRHGRRAIAAVFAAVVIASLSFSILEARAQDPAGYFLTTTRAWELAVGGIIALLLPRIRVPAVLRSPLSLLGLAVIGVGTLIIDGDTPFPGTAALVPVLGAVAVILAGTDEGRFSPAPVYRWRPVQRLGDMSYSLYLWHYPPIVFFAAIVGRAPGWAWSILLGTAAIAAAWLSWRFVELPTRGSAWLAARSRRGLLLGAAGIACTLVLAVSLPVTAQRTEAKWVRAAAAVDARGAQGAAAMTPAADRFFTDGTVAMTPSPSVARHDQEKLLPGHCMAVPKAATTPVCVAGDAHGTIRVALVGDSHANMLAPVIVAIAEQRGWRVETHLHASCPFNLEERALEVRGGSVCRSPNAATLKALLADPPDVVFVASWASGDFEASDTGQQPGLAGYATIWNRLTAAGSEVVAFKDVPKPRSNPLAVDCLAVHYTTPQDCGMPRDEALQGRDVVEQAQRLAPAVHIVDLTDRLCGTRTCPAVIGNVVVYRDSNHLTNTFVQTLLPYVEQRLPHGLPGSPAA
ncbi:MAG TPA: acyltransferase family protein [Microbacterium sp.]|nr:acyltransferase family protein [Microbacterium sp.]